MNPAVRRIKKLPIEERMVSSMINDGYPNLVTPAHYKKAAADLKRRGVVYETGDGTLTRAAKEIAEKEKR